METDMAPRTVCVCVRDVCVRMLSLCDCQRVCESETCDDTSAKVS